MLTKKFDYSNPAEGKLGKLTPKVNPLLKNVNMLAAIDSDEDDSEYGCQDGEDASLREDAMDNIFFLMELGPSHGSNNNNDWRK